jgi:hypothetical protein
VAIAEIEIHPFVGAGENPRLQGRSLELYESTKKNNQKGAGPPQPALETPAIEKGEEPRCRQKNAGEINRDGFTVHLNVAKNSITSDKN